jgi:hypothetical protein
MKNLRTHHEGRGGTKDLSGQPLALREEEEGNGDRHRRVELRTAITSGKRRTKLQDPQKGFRFGIREVSKRNVQRVAEGEKPEPVERSAPPKTEKETAYGAGAGNVEAPVHIARERELRMQIMNLD